MWAKITVTQTTNGEVKESITLQGSEGDARVLHGLLNGIVSSVQDGEVSELSVTAQKRIPASPTYEPIDLG